MTWLLHQNVVFLALLAGLFLLGVVPLSARPLFSSLRILRARRKLLDIMMGFAAGWDAMIFVVTEELIPESQTNGNTDVATLGLMVGFVVMMVMDVALG